MPRIWPGMRGAMRITGSGALAAAGAGVAGFSATSFSGTGISATSFSMGDLTDGLAVSLAGAGALAVLGDGAGEAALVTGISWRSVAPALAAPYGMVGRPGHKNRTPPPVAGRRRPNAVP